MVDADLLIIHQQDLRHLLTEYEHSIAKAKIAAFEQKPIGLVLTSQNEERRIVPVRNSFATVQELELRRVRMDSLLSNSGFLLIDEPKTMRMPSLDVLQKFKVGLKDALYITERLSDFVADSSPHQTNDNVDRRESQAAPDSSPNGNNTTVNDHSGAELGLGPFASDDAEIFAYNAQLATQFRQMEALRGLQAVYLRALPSRDLAWVLTLAAGASKGYARYSYELLKNDPAMADARVMAFKEVLLRGGPFFLWAFMRGTGSLGSFVRRAIWQVAEEVLFFEENVEIGGQRVPDGLHMTIMGELRRRLVEARCAQAGAEGLVFDDEGFGSSDVWKEVNAIVGREVGWSGWKGYAAVIHPRYE